MLQYAMINQEWECQFIDVMVHAMTCKSLIFAVNGLCVWVWEGFITFLGFVNDCIEFFVIYRQNVGEVLGEMGKA